MKQVIVVRKDLSMRAGKMVAQGCHASSRICMRLAREFETNAYSPNYLEWWKTWMKEGETKICLRVESEDQLMAIHDLIKNTSIPYALITDAGHTEFKGVPTKTCLALGPAPDEEVDAITGHLKLL